MKTKNFITNLERIHTIILNMYNYILNRINQYSKLISFDLLKNKNANFFLFKFNDYIRINETPKIIQAVFGKNLKISFSKTIVKLIVDN